MLWPISIYYILLILDDLFDLRMIWYNYYQSYHTHVGILSCRHFSSHLCTIKLNNIPAFIEQTETHHAQLEEHNYTLYVAAQTYTFLTRGFSQTFTCALWQATRGFHLMTVFIYEFEPHLQQTPSINVLGVDAFFGKCGYSASSVREAPSLFFHKFVDKSIFEFVRFGHI